MSRVKAGLSIFLMLFLSIACASALDSNLYVSALNPVIKTNPCELSQFKFNVKNTGNYAEYYKFSIIGFTDYAVLSANDLFLAPGQTSRVDIFVNPDCGIYGEQKIKFQALAAASGYLAETDVVLDIKRNYDYEVAMPENVNICNYKQNIIPIHIKNNVKILNQYDIEINGPSWLMQEAGRVELAPYGRGITNLAANPKNPGSYLAEISFKSFRGDVVKKGILNITVEKCYAPKINIDSPSDIIVNGKTAKYPVIIKNDGTKKDIYEFELTAPEFVSLDAGKTALNPGEEKTLTLTASPDINTTGNYRAAINIISAETNTAKQDVIMLKVISSEEAYNLKISPKNTRVLYGKDEVAVELYNKGLLPGKYELTLNAHDWIKLNTKSITLEPDSKETVYIETNADEHEQGNYEAQLIANVKDSNIGFISTFNIKLREITLAQELTLLAKRYIYFVIVGIIILVIAVFTAVFGKRIARGYRNWKIKQKETAKAKAEIKAKKKEEKAAKKLIKKSLKAKISKQEIRPKIKRNKTLGIILILTALILLAGAVLGTAGYGSFITELFKSKQEKIFEPMVAVDTEELEAFGNNVIIRGKETAIPLIVSNNYDTDVVFDVNIKDSWIRTDTRKVELEPGEQEKINLVVRPEEGAEGIYKIEISAVLKKDNKVFTENINLNIKKRNLLREVIDYVWYFAAGLVLLIIGLIVGRKRKRKPTIEPKKEETKVFSKLKYKPIRKINVSLPKKR